MELEQGRKLFKADLHVHSRHSGMAKHLQFLRARDCYSQPLDVYRTAKKRGMDLVTITDHDSIGGCLEVLNRLGPLPDFIVGEEVTAWFPEFCHDIHIGVYDITEAQHREIQKLRPNGNELVAYLKQQDIVFALNHFFHNFAHTERVRDYIRQMATLFRIFEVRNGSQQREHSEFIQTLLSRFYTRQGGCGAVAGSDAHTLRRIGRTYTASFARTREEFLQDIREGRTQVFGRHSNHLSLAADIYGVVLRYYPNLFLPRWEKFPVHVRLKNMLLSLLTPPFLITPYLVALRHSLIERSRIHRYASLLQTESV